MTATQTDQTAPFVGQAATLTYYTDSRAAVVTKVSPKTIVIALVEVGASTPDERCDAGAFGVRPMKAEGILDEPVPGTELRFSWNARRGCWMNQGTRARLGSSITWVDYRR